MYTTLHNSTELEDGSPLVIAESRIISTSVSLPWYELVVIKIPLSQDERLPNVSERFLKGPTNPMRGERETRR